MGRVRSPSRAAPLGKCTNDGTGFANCNPSAAYQAPQVSQKDQKAVLVLQIAILIFLYSPDDDCLVNMILSFNNKNIFILLK